MFTKLQESTKYIEGLTKIKPQIGLVLGSGLGDFAEQLDEAQHFPYESIPHFLPPSVEGHEGKLVIGKIAGVPIVCLQGRVHLYEGHELEKVVHPVRTLAMLGIKQIILTNAAGGISNELHPGDLALITDHLNLTGKNPLIGPNEAKLGTRFPDMSDAYSERARKIVSACAQELGVNLPTGVYVGLLGPSYETPAEIRMFKSMGADMVGMSTVLETIATHHMGVEVIGLSCITNYAAGISKNKLNHDEVKEVALKAKEKFKKLLVKTIETLGK